MQTNFLDLARRGKNEWWRYALSTLLILFLWIGGSVVLALFLVVDRLITKDTRPGMGAATGLLEGIDPLLLVTVLLLSFLPLLAGLLLAVRFIHQRPVASLVTPLAHIDWKRMGIGFLAFGALVGLSSIVEAFLYPDRYQFSFDLLKTLKFLPVVLILIPFQAAAEELLLRGYMMQGLGLLTHRAWIPVVISSVVFMLLHLSNPEAQVDTWLMLGIYLGFALLFALVTLKDNRLELAMGMHIANNLFVLLVNNSVSTLPVPPVFTVTAQDAGYGLISLVISGAIFYGVLHFSQRTKVPDEIETV